MTNVSDTVRQRYAMSGILDRVNAFLLERGIDPERPTYQDFLPFDQLHGLGVQATREHNSVCIGAGYRTSDIVA